MPSPWKPIERDAQVPDKQIEPDAPQPPLSEKAIELRETFVARDPVRRLADLIVTDATRAQINLMLTKIKHQKTLYQDWNLARLDPFGERTALNLWGPPGTGKTLCAEAIAADLGQRILDVNYAELESKYVGETSKNIAMAFKAAAEQNAVLFFDEADSILGKRLTDVRASADYGVNQSRSVMLKQLESFQGVVIFATNLARNYDGAFVRRILGHIEFELPDHEGRVRLWEHFLLPTIPRAEDVNPDALAELSDGLSGGELLNVLVAAASAAVGRPVGARKIALEDFESQAEAVKRARAEIGNFDYDTPKVSEKRVALSDLPPDVRASADGKHRTLTEYRWIDMPREFVAVGLRALEDVIEADGVRTDQEVDAVRVVLANFPHDEAESMFAASKGLGMDSAPAELVGTPWARLIVRDAVTMGFCDGKFTDDERAVVERWAHALGVHTKFVRRAESWSVRALQWSLQGNALLHNPDDE